jgi:hypothetical protein
MGKLSVIQNKPDRHVASQWPHQDGRRAADKVRPDYLDFLRDTEGVGSLIVADSDGCGVKFDNQKVILNHGDMLFWLPWVRHCGKCFLTWLFAGLTFFRCFLGLPYPKVAVESGSRLFRRLHAYWHLNGRKDLDDIEGIHCREVRTRTHKSTRTQTHTHTNSCSEWPFLSWCVQICSAPSRHLGIAIKDLTSTQRAERECQCREYFASVKGKWQMAALSKTFNLLLHVGHKYFHHKNDDPKEWIKVSSTHTHTHTREIRAAAAAWTTRTQQHQHQHQRQRCQRRFG